MTDNPFEIYTHNVCAGDTSGDIPDWLFYAVCALPYLLLALGCIGD